MANDPFERAERVLNVATGEVKACRTVGRLRAAAVGSCVIAATYDAEVGVGGMAHVMLPGACPDGSSSRRTRYAEDAVKEMLRRMTALGAQQGRVCVCLVGGANVLGQGHESPGPEVVRSLNRILDRRGVTVVSADTGGTRRRSCCLDVGRERVTYTVGDSPDRTLWEAGIGEVVETTGEITAVRIRRQWSACGRFPPAGWQSFLPGSTSARRNGQSPSPRVHDDRRQLWDT